MSFTIKELESLTGIKAHTIRIWEQRYQFLAPSRTQTNIRRYNNEELKILLTVALLNKYGYKISKIDSMSPPDRVGAAMQLQCPEARVEYIINDLIGCMVDLNSAGFERILNDHITRQGIEQTITGIIFPFLDRVGILWLTNQLRPVQEHIVSNIVRQKLITAIDALPLTKHDRPACVLFLPEAEHHELGLLYVYYMLRRRNYPTIYLGANVPVKDLHFIVDLKQPAFLYLHLTSYPGQQKFQRFLQQLQDEAGQTPVVLSGYVAQFLSKKPADSYTLLQSLEAVNNYIHQLPASAETV